MTRNTYWNVCTRIAGLRLLTMGLTFTLILVFSGCGDDSTEPDLTVSELGVVVNSGDVSLTVFDVDDPGTSQAIGLGPAGSPVTLATNGGLAAVPLGFVPALAVVDLVQASLLRTVSLPMGSGATGVDFVNDSIVLVANSSLNTVSPVNVLSGTVLPEIDVGVFPQGVITVGGSVYVINANLDVNFQPAGPATLTVLNATTLQVVNTIQLSGENAIAAAVGPNGLLYVVQAGSFGQSNGSLSIVDLSTGSELDNFTGFGDFPGSVAVDDQRLVYVGAFGVGMTVWDAVTESFIATVEPAGVASTTGVGFDSGGRLYTLTPDCVNPAEAHRLAANFTVDLSIPVGICPFSISFTEVEGS